MSGDGRPRRYVLRWEHGGEYHADTLEQVDEARRRRRECQPDSVIVVHDLWDYGREMHGLH